MLITDREIAYVIEAEYPEAKWWENFWVGYRTTNNQGIQEVDSEIVAWEIDGVPQPTAHQVADLVANLRAAGGLPTAVPPSVTRRQGRLALLEVGKLIEVEGMIAAIEDSVQQMKAKIEYDADTWERANPFLQATWALVSEPKPDLDALFILAGSK